MLEDVQRTSKMPAGPLRFARLKRFAQGIQFLWQYSSIIQIGLVEHEESDKYEMRVRYGGLDPDDVEQILEEFLEHVKGEKAQLQMARKILNNTN